MLCGAWPCMQGVSIAHMDFANLARKPNTLLGSRVDICWDELLWRGCEKRR